MLYIDRESVVYTAGKNCVRYYLTLAYGTLKSLGWIWYLNLFVMVDE